MWEVREAQGHSQCAMFLDLSSGHISVHSVMFIKLYTYFLYIFLYNLTFS